MPYKKSKVVYLLLALFFGAFGFHHFYLGNNKKGIMYFLFCWTYIPIFLAIRDMFIVGRSFEEYEKKCLCEEAANNFRMNEEQKTRAYRDGSFRSYENVYHEDVHHENIKKENYHDEKQREKKADLDELVFQGQLSKDGYNFIKALTPVERKFIGEFKHLKMDILAGSVFSNDQGVTTLALVDEINDKSSKVFQKEFIKLGDDGYSIYENYRSLVELMDRN